MNQNQFIKLIYKVTIRRNVVLHKKVVFNILVCITLIITGCNRIVSIDVEDINIEYTTGINEWLGKSQENNIHVCKIKNNSNEYEYYLYLNKIKIKGYSIEPDGKEGLNVKIDIDIDRPPIIKLVKIIPRNKQPKYIIINNEKILSEDILDLSR